MLSKECIKEVQELLAEGKYSQRMISRMTGVSRVVVHRIATGKRKIVERPPLEEWEKERKSKEFERCPLCGCKVLMPCLGCILKKYVRSHVVPRFNDPGDSSMSIQLEGKHRVRYELVKAWRESQSNPNFSELPENWPFRDRKKRSPNDFS